MTIKRVSYFTFLVAMTTIASVTTCGAAKDREWADIKRLQGIIEKQLIEHYDHLEGSVGPSYEWPFDRPCEQTEKPCWKSSACIHDLELEVVGIRLGVHAKNEQGGNALSADQAFFTEGLSAQLHLPETLALTRQTAAPRIGFQDRDQRIGIASRNRILLE